MYPHTVIPEDISVDNNMVMIYPSVYPLTAFEMILWKQTLNDFQRKLALLLIIKGNSIKEEQKLLIIILSHWLEIIHCI